MKKTLLLLLLSGTGAHAQEKSKEELNKLDDLIGNPFSKPLVTDRAYSKLLYKDQQAIGGSVVKEGRAIGTSATVEETGLTVNVGSPVIKKYFAAQGTFKAISEEGFIKVFSDGEYQRTLGGGATALVFLNFCNKSVYAEQTRVALHRKLRNLRHANEGVSFSGDTYSDSGNKDGWQDKVMPYGESAWTKKSQDSLAALVTQRNSFLTTGLKSNAGLIKRFYANKLTSAEQHDSDILTTYRAYQQAELNVKRLLPAEWFSFGKESEDEFIRKVSTPAERDKLIKKAFDKASEAQRESRLAVYDTLQLKASWVRRRRVWASVNMLYNVATQPLYDGSVPDKAFKGKGYDEYWDSKIAVNGLWIYGWGKIYASAGAGWNNMRVFDKEKLKTYQLTKKTPGSVDSIRVVKQAEVYPVFPDKVNYTTLQSQFSLYWTNKIGIDLTLREKYAKNQPSYHAATFGIFYPIKAGETTLLLMPQAKWNTENRPRAWTFGFNISASIPGFVTKENK